MTKLAMLRLENCKEWKDIGGRIIICVHDELLCEVPLEHWKRGGELLSQNMVEAGSFLPFSMKCDVTTTFRWYGESYPCEYPKPDHSSDFAAMSPENIKWIQVQLREMEYLLPVFLNEDGSKAIGDAAHGINGKCTDEMVNCIFDYVRKRGITVEEFIDTIEHEVMYTRHGASKE